MYMLWFSDESKPLAERVSRAADYYGKKYGRSPTKVLVPKGEDTTGVSGLTCAEDQYVLPSHLMIGGD